MKKLWIIGIIVATAAFSGCFFPGPCIQGYGPVTEEIRDLADFTAVSNTASFDVRVTQADTFSVVVEAQENLLSIIETYVSGSTLILKTRNGTCYNSVAPVIVNVSLPLIEEIRNTGSGELSADRAETDEFECSNTGSGILSIDSVFASVASFKNSGSGKVYAEALFLDELSLVQTGSGSLDAGTAYGILECHINHTSSGKIWAYLEGSLEVDARLTGSGRIQLAGDTDMAEYTLSASGRIDAIELVALDVKATHTGSGKIYVFARDYLDVTITGSGDVFYLGNPVITSRITGSGSLRPY
jgi:hypothetical protein